MYFLLTFFDYLFILFGKIRMWALGMISCLVVEKWFDDSC